MRRIICFVVMLHACADIEAKSAICEKHGRHGWCIEQQICRPSGLLDINGSGIEQNCSVRELFVENRTTCGWRHLDGVGGHLVEDDGIVKYGEFPWFTAILSVDTLSITTYVGAGSLIHRNVVLTTAHLVAGQDRLRARSGEWDTQSDEEFPYQERDVAKVVIHEHFDRKVLFYDVALLFLAKPMDLAPNVGLACLPQPRQEAASGTRCFACGWGKDVFGKAGRYQVILKKVEVPVVDHTTCQNQLRKTRLGRLFELHSSFMCAGGEPDKDTCKGDGGSPLVCPMENDRYVQHGMVAWGIGCGEDGTPGVYVDVSLLRDWIDDKMIGQRYELDYAKY